MKEENKERDCVLKNYIKYCQMISRTWEQVHVVLENREMNREDTEDAGNIGRCLSLLAANCDVMVAGGSNNNGSNSIGNGSSAAVPLTTAFFWRTHTQGA